MLVLSTLGAERAAPRLRRGKVQAIDPPAPVEPLPLTRATLIRPIPFSSGAEADAWLSEVCSDPETWRALAAEAAAQLNRALHAYKTSAGDPYVAEVSSSKAIAVRFGYGSGEEVADGRWRRANELSERERRKLLSRDYEALRPQERMAAVLGGRERVAPYEGLVLLARSDLDAGRVEAAALALRAALEALLADQRLREHPAVRNSEAYERLVSTPLPSPSATGGELEQLLALAESVLRRSNAA